MHIKKVGFAIIFLLVFLLFSLPCFAISNSSIEQKQAEQIDNMINEQMRRSKIPQISVAVLSGDDVSYYSFSDNTSENIVDQDSLFQIGSVSKAFTGLGILLLEEEGYLSISDPVSKYIPWFSVNYNDTEVNPNDLTIANLLYQNSGFTNDEAIYPRATPDMTLEQNIQQTSGCELEFYPSDRYSYANTNYYLLGYIIQVVSGQTYEDFMHDNIFTPLGLNHTYASPEYISDNEYLVQGSRLSFFSSHPYTVPISQGNVPAGYIITNASDLSRWMQFQMGTIETPKPFKTIIDKSHQINPSSIVNDHTQYATGWFVDEAENRIYHSGGTVNFSANVEFRPNEDIGVCVLTNMNASVNTDTIAKNVLDILEGKKPVPYKNDIWMIFDNIFSTVTLVGGVGIISITILLFVSIRQINNGQRKRKHVKKLAIKLILPMLFVVVSIINLIILPNIFGANWESMLLWGPISILTGSITLLLISILLLANVIVLTIFKPIKDSYL